MSPPRTGLRGARMVLGVAVAGLLGGCRDRPEPCVITGVTVVQGPGPSTLEPLGLERDDLRRMALQAFGRTAGFQVPSSEPARGARRCRGEVSLVDARHTTSGRAQAEVLLRLEVAPGDDADAISETVRASEAIQPGEGVQAAFRRAIEGGSARAAGALALTLAEARKPDAEVIADLESGDARVRDRAVAVLADRKNPAAVPALLTRLQDPDPEVADRAVGALGQIGDPRAVRPLIDLSRRREGPFVAQMVRIVGDIGGPEAEAYLETMAAGHPDPAVATAAREALQDARRRRGEAKSRGLVR